MENKVPNEVQFSPNEEKSALNEIIPLYQGTPSSLLNEFLKVVRYVLITWFVWMMFVAYIFHPVPVNIIGMSMQPALNPDDKIFMTTVVYKITCGDMIIIGNDAAYLINPQTGSVEKGDSGLFNECIIKRVIACSGQTINIDFDTGDVYVDGVVKDEPFIKEMIGGRMQPEVNAFEYPLTIPAGYCFVMGDNRNNSADSRHKSVGLIKRDQIYGKAILKYSPFSDFQIF